MNELALFAGAGGGILGGKLLGWRTVCAVEISSFCARRLMQRQNEGHLPPFPIWDDVRTFDGRPWKGIVDVVSGGFPCQDISAAGKGAGISGKKSGLWVEMARIVGEVRPRYCFVENSPMLTVRGLDRVLGDFSEMGYDAGWGVIGAHHVGAPHKRDRIWIVAHSTRFQQGRKEQRTQRQRIGQGGKSIDVPDAERAERRPCDSGRCRVAGDDNSLQKRKKNTSRSGICSKEMANSDCEGLSMLEGQPIRAKPDGRGFAYSESWWIAEPSMGRVANGVANRVDRLKAIGNGQVPAVAKIAWEILTDNQPLE